MKIVDSNNIANLYMRRARSLAQEEANQPNGKKTAQEIKTDTVSLSSEARKIDQARELAQTMPDERVGKVEEIKNQIEAGVYQIDAQKIADKMIRHIVDIYA